MQDTEADAFVVVMKHLSWVWSEGTHAFSLQQDNNWQQDDRVVPDNIMKRQESLMMECEEPNEARVSRSVL